MSKLPDIRRIEKGDLGDPTDDLMKVVDSLNRFMETTYDALTALTFKDNFLSQIKQVELKASSVGNGEFPVSLKHGLSTRISGVLVMRALRTDTTYFTPVADGVTVDWQESADDLIIQNVSGLDFTTGEERYTITILVV